MMRSGISCLPRPAAAAPDEASLPNYREALGIVRKLYRSAGDTDKRIIAGMVSDCEFVVEWMETGRRPGSRRGIERRAGYEREVPLEPERMQRFAAPPPADPALREEEGESLSGRRLFQLEYALSRLSARERECYELAYGQGLSHGDIAVMLRLTAGSVGEYLQRAQQKMAELVADSLFYMDDQEENV